MVTLLTMQLTGPIRIFIAQSSWHFGDFRNIFMPNIGEGQNESYHLSTGPPALRHLVNPPLVIALRL